MQKQYQDIGTLIKQFGLRESVTHKFLEFRDKYPLANRLFSELALGHINSSAYSGSYVALWDAEGRLAHFNPNPSYPEDFRPIDYEAHQPVRRLTEAEFQERIPTEFAHAVSQILAYEH